MISNHPEDDQRAESDSLEMIDEIESLQSQIATLTAERDEAKSGNDFLRQEVEDWKEANRRAEAERDEARKEAEQFRSDRETVIHNIQKLNQEFIELTAELATLRSCPEMGEVDAVMPTIADVDIARDLVIQERDHGRLWEPFRDKVDALANLARVAIHFYRQAIASHATEKQRADEVERLLKDAAAYSDGRIETRAKSGDEDAAKILAICGKGDG